LSLAGVRAFIESSVEIIDPSPRRNFHANSHAVVNERSRSRERQQGRNASGVMRRLFQSCFVVSMENRRSLKR
jgi:hypothetical protein